MSDEISDDVRKPLDSTRDVVELSKVLMGLLNINGDKAGLIEYLRKLGKFHPNDDLFRYAQLMGIHHAMISEIPMLMKAEGDRLESILKNLRVEESHFADIMEIFRKEVETSIDDSAKCVADTINKQIFKTVDESGIHGMVNLMALTTTEMGFSNSELQTTLHAMDDAVDQAGRHISYLSAMCESATAKFYWGSIMVSLIVGLIVGGIIVGFMH